MKAILSKVRKFFRPDPVVQYLGCALDFDEAAAILGMHTDGVELALQSGALESTFIEDIREFRSERLNDMWAAVRFDWYQPEKSPDLMVEVDDDATADDMKATDDQRATLH